MSANLIPSDPTPGPVSPYASAGAIRGWESPRQPEGAFNIAEQLSRVWSAIQRYKWLILAIVAVGSSAGYALTRLVAPKYDVNATIWIAKGMGPNGPISSPGLISNDLAWPDLARS